MAAPVLRLCLCQKAHIVVESIAFNFTMHSDTYLFFLGSHPALSFLELEQVCGRYEQTVSLLLPSVAKCQWAGGLPENLIDRLGGVDRIVRVVGTYGSVPEAGDILSALPMQKLTLGLSFYGSDMDLQPLAEKLKGLARKRGVKLRFVLPKDARGQLNAAQIMFNKLDRKRNSEVTIIPAGEVFFLTRTTQVQDIRAYEIRDTSRPARHGKVGMLSPKLAQMMINIAVGGLKAPTIFDPFCGMGTILQEGRLMGLPTTGSDISSEMVHATRQNLEHLERHFRLQNDPRPEVFQHDATRSFPARLYGQFDAIVTEPHLGRALTTPLPHREVDRAVAKLRALYRTAFKRFSLTLKPGGRVLFLLPAFRQGRRFTLFPASFLDEIESLQYRKVQLQDRADMLYARPGALVGRELTLWERNNGT